MKRRILASAVVLAFILALGPVPRAAADGGASTRNILLGVGAAAGTLIIINHNKQVHEHYAQDAANQAALANQRNDAEAAYRAEIRAYNHEVAVSDNLKKEVALKDKVIADQNLMLDQQKQQLAQLGLSAQPVAIAPAPSKSTTRANSMAATSEMVSYGWGTL
jgi:hypothetical protein